MQLLERRPGFQARIFAEAQSLIDDGLDPDLVVELYGEEASWLSPLLSQADRVASAARSQEPSWYFEASLKQKFIEAGERNARNAASTPMIAPAPAGATSRFRAGLAGTGVAAGAGIAGVLALGMLTADDAAPGDWNYAFRLGAERLDYRLSDSEARVSVQVQQADKRVKEIIEISNSGSSVSQQDLTRVEEEFKKVQELAQDHPFDEKQQEKVKEAGEAAKRVLADVGQSNPELVEQAKKTEEVVNDAVAAATGGPVSPIVEPSPSPSPSPTPSPAATPSPTASPTATATATATQSPSATPTETATPSPSEEPTEPPSPTATPTETPVEEVSPSAEAGE